ncbi:MAG: DUF1569 domain-containing protein [Planctomycetales bacterium]|nr:DUF1569 domain-containing protein [Planctomycetales bacterium]
MKRRELRLATLSECVDEVQRLHERGYDRAGQWDLAKVCNHLDKACRMTVDGTSFSLPFFVPYLMRFLFLKKVLRGDPMSVKAKAPPTMEPVETIGEPEAIERFRDAVRLLEDPDTKYVDFHPVFGRLDREQWKKVQAWHCAHHLSFLLPRQQQPAG